MAERKVLIIGATGYIASQVLQTCRERYSVMLLDVKEVDRDGIRVPDVTVADLSDPDLGGYMRHFQAVDTVVHLGYKRRRGVPIDDFYDEQVNVSMAYNVFRAAYESGVRRVVMASSNHAADWYEHALIHGRKMEMVEPYQLPLSDNFYGWAKATYEHIGFLFACGVFGRKLEVVMLRIGAARELKAEDYEGSPWEFKRDLGAHLSQRDLCQLLTRAIETTDIVDRNGIPWLVVYGVSDNARAFWSLANAREVLGYLPEDDSEVKYARDIRRLLTGEGAPGKPGRVGG